MEAVLVKRAAAIAALEELSQALMRTWDLKESAEVDAMAERIKAMREHEQPAAKAA